MTMSVGLTSIEIMRLLKLLAEVEVVAPTSAFPYSIKHSGFGYKDGEDGKLQAKLSIMAQAAIERERGV